MASGGLPQWRAERLLGLLTAGERLRPERQPRQLFADHPQLVLRAGFAEPVDQPDQRDMLLGQFKELFGCLLPACVQFERRWASWVLVARMMPRPLQIRAPT